MANPPDPLEPYWAALGKFLHRYALVETSLSYVLRMAAGVSHAKATALFSGTRVPNAISFIRRIHEADGLALSPWLEKALPQLNTLTAARDEILHQGFSLVGDKIIVTNRTRNLPRAAFERPYSVADLLAMEADTCVIHACLNMYWLEKHHPNSRKKMHARERSIAELPWRHKSPSPTPSQRKTPKAARKQSAPHRS